MQCAMCAFSAWIGFLEAPCCSGGSVFRRANSETVRVQLYNNYLASWIIIYRQIWKHFYFVWLEKNPILDRSIVAAMVSSCHLPQDALFRIHFGQFPFHFDYGPCGFLQRKEAKLFKDQKLLLFPFHLWDWVHYTAVHVNPYSFSQNYVQIE